MSVSRTAHLTRLKALRDELKRVWVLRRSSIRLISPQVNQNFPSHATRYTSSQGPSLASLEDSHRSLVSDARYSSPRLMSAPPADPLRSVKDCRLERSRNGVQASAGGGPLQLSQCSSVTVTHLHTHADMMNLSWRTRPVPRRDELRVVGVHSNSGMVLTIGCLSA